ncbi:ABC transporter permease [Paenibacillus thermoaerophilus]
MEQSELALYRRRGRIERRWIAVCRLSIVLVFFGWWEWAGRLGWVDPLLFSYPSRIVGLLRDMAADGSLWPHLGWTVAETVIGFALGTLLGTALAAWLWWSRFLARMLDPFLVVLNSLPKVALGPLFIVGLGPGLSAIVANALAITVIITTIHIYNSFREVDPNYIKLVRLFGGSKRTVFVQVVLPATVPSIVSSLKVNVGLAWVGVIVGEFLVSKQGLGYLIIYGFQVFNFTLVFASLFVIAVVATVMYQAVAWLEKRYTPKDKPN